MEAASFVLFLMLYITALIKQGKIDRSPTLMTLIGQSCHSI